MFYQRKKWKKRDNSDPEWMKLGDSPDARRQRADEIKREERRFWMWVIGIVVTILIGFFSGYVYKNVDLYEAAENHPRGGLNIPAQWFMMESMIGWEKMMLIFGYANNIDICEHLVEVAKEESPDRNFRCTDAN